MFLKKILCVVMSTIIPLGAITFFGCSDNQEPTPTSVMTVSINPKVEFILDEKDKVLTVSSLNDEGNLIISSNLFKNIKGKDKAEAINLFIQISKDTGYLITGKINDGENQIKVAFSGDDASELFLEVKDKVKNYLEEIGVQATLKEEQKIKTEKLQELLIETVPHLKENEIMQMDSEQLIKELAIQRKETAEIYSQEIKEAYYEAKAFALKKAEFEVLKEKLPEIIKVAMDGLTQSYSDIIKAVETVRFNQFIKEDSLYQIALKNLRETKIDYINLRNEIAKMEMDGIEVSEEKYNELNEKKYQMERVDGLEDKLVQARENAEKLIEEVLAELDGVYNDIIGVINELDLENHVDEVSKIQKQRLNKFFTEFENNYKQATEKAKNDWQYIEEQLNQKPAS